MGKMKRSRPLGKAINYTAPQRSLSGYRDSLISTQVWLTKNDDLTLRQQLTSSVSTIFASTISLLAGYHQFQINNRASRVICIQVFNKNI